MKKVKIKGMQLFNTFLENNRKILKMKCKQIHEQ